MIPNALAGIRELKAQYDTEGRRLDVLIREADLESYKSCWGADQNVSLSKESEYELTHGVLGLAGELSRAREKVKPRLTGLISAQQTMDELDIKYKTLQRWENAGLKTIQTAARGC